MELEHYYELYNTILKTINKLNIYGNHDYRDIYSLISNENPNLFLELEGKYEVQKVGWELVRILKSMIDDGTLKGKCIETIPVGFVKIDYISKMGHDYLQMLESEKLQTKIKRIIKDTGIKVSTSFVMDLCKNELLRLLNIS